MYIVGFYIYDIIDDTYYYDELKCDSYENAILVVSKLSDYIDYEKVISVIKKGESQ